MNTSAPSSTSSARPRSSRGFVSCRERVLDRGQPRAAAVHAPRAVAADDVAHARGEQDLGHGRARRADPGDDDPDVVELLADELERVQQRREDDDRRPVLVVMEDRDIERLAQPPLDLEAARR